MKKPSFRLNAKLYQNNEHLDGSPAVKNQDETFSYQLIETSDCDHYVKQLTRLTID